MFYCQKIFEKEFISDCRKDAYMSACKWAASNIYSNPDFAEIITVSYKKIGINGIKLEVYLKSDMDREYKSFCQKCVALHNIFYSTEKHKCNGCKADAFKKILENSLKVQGNFIHKILEGK